MSQARKQLQQNVISCLQSDVPRGHDNAAMMEQWSLLLLCFVDPAQAETFAIRRVSIFLPTNWCSEGYGSCMAEPAWVPWVCSPMACFATAAR
jgi:hypothetical protein